MTAGDVEKDGGVKSTTKAGDDRTVLFVPYEVVPMQSTTCRPPVAVIIVMVALTPGATDTAGVPAARKSAATCVPAVPARGRHAIEPT